MKQLAQIMLVIIIVVQCIACDKAAKRTAQQAEQTDTVKNKNMVHVSSESKGDTLTAYTDPVYKSYISTTLKKLIEEKLPGWRLPSSGSWEKYWFNAYKKADALVDYASADFNGDGKFDYALLLENKNHAFIIWVLQSQSNGYKVIQLTELSEATLPLNFGLELVDKGNLDHLSMDENEDAIKTVELKYPGIQVSFFETSAETYYWKDGKYQSVITGD